MRAKPIISIVIPTRNRAFYAKHCIESVLDIKYDNFELIVHDNSDTEELYDYINENIIDERLVYHYDNSPMNTVHNFNKAMSYVNGEYICFIGDDDGVIPQIFEVVTWAKKNNVDAVTYNNRVGYQWPSMDRKGTLRIYPYDSRIEKIDVKKELDNFLASGAVYYLNHKLPKVYHGIIRKTCFDSVNQKLGYYFGGLSVDIFSSVSLSIVIDKLIFIDYPLTIAGSSAASEQTHRTEEARKKKLEDAPHFNNRGRYSWSDEVPRLYSGATIWAESGIQALKDFGKIEFVKRINLNKLVAYVILSNTIIDETILNEYLKRRGLRKNFIYFTIVLIQIQKYLNKITNRLIKIFKAQGIKNIDDVESITIAIKIVGDIQGKKYPTINLPNIAE